MLSNIKNNSMTRRRVLAGAATIAAGTAVSGSAMASMAPFAKTATSGAAGARKAASSATLARYLCDRTHNEIAKRLDATIADPSIDGEQTAKALMEARCPGCGERVSPAHSSIAAVIPKWNPPSRLVGKGAVA